MLTEDTIRSLFPGISNFQITSDADESYNCIAWSVNDTKRFWWPFPKRFIYWPPGAARDETVAAFIGMYKLLLFEPCESGEREEGYDKVALYAKGEIPTHAARFWKEDGSWCSKLGEENDITHHSLGSLEGGEYGKVVQIMKRKRPTQ